MSLNNLSNGLDDLGRREDALADDDQIVPIGDSALLSSKIVKDATLKVYPGAPHGLAQTTAYKDTFNTDLLNFIKA